MAIKVRSRRRLLALTMGLALLVLTVPVQAEHVGETFVAGGTTCATLPGGPSAGSSSFTITAPARNGIPYTLEPGVTVTLSGVDNRTATFTFTIEGGEVFDVIVKGSGSNWYHYDDPVTTGSVHIPNGNKLNLIHFCYTPGVPFPEGNAEGCAFEVAAAGETATGTFTRTSNCDDDKRVIAGVDNGIITFIPFDGEPSTYTGVLTFIKDSSSTEALQLQYDPNGGTAFVDVPDCDSTGSSPLPDDGSHRWCVVSASADYEQRDTDGDWVWTITWNVYGEGDPTFK